MSKKLQCEQCKQAAFGEDLYNYDGHILCRYCVVSRVCESHLASCEYAGSCDDNTYKNYEEEYKDFEDFITTLGFKNKLKFKEYVLNCLLNKEDKANRIRELEQYIDDHKPKTPKISNVIIQNLRVDVAELKQKLADTEAQNKRVLEKLELLVKDNQDLQQQLAEKDETIEKLNNALVLDRSSGKWIKLCELQDKLAENAQYTEQLLKDNAQLKKSVEGKDKEISQLKKALEAEYNSGFVWEGEARTAWDELEKKDKEIEYLKRKENRDET